MIGDKVQRDLAKAEQLLASHSGWLNRTPDGYDRLAGEVMRLLADVSPNPILDRLELSEGVGAYAIWRHTAINFERRTLLPQAHWI